MRKRIILFIGLMLMLLIATGCGSTPAPSSPAPLPPRTTAQPAAASTNTPAPNAASGVTPTLTLIPTTPIPTTTPPPPTPVIPAGLYITSLDVAPDPPTRGNQLEFYATFANTSGNEQTFRWIVYIYRPDNPIKSFGETTATTSILQLGAYTQKSLGNWKLPLGGPCENFTARVAWLDQNNQSTPFLRPDGQVFEKPMTICAQSDLPPVTPTLTGQPTPTVTPAPGLFVTALRTDPNPPTRGSDLIFYPTFSNTTGTVQNYRWVVYIYTPDNPVRSYGQTSAQQTAFPAGESEQKSLGSWGLPLGGPCEEFVARVSWLDQNNQATRFAKPDGGPFEKNLTVCPP